MLNCMISSTFAGYIAQGSEFTETLLDIAKQYPNYVNKNVSDLNPMRFRINPNSISGFNSSVNIFFTILFA